MCNFFETAAATEKRAKPIWDAAAAEFPNPEYIRAYVVAGQGSLTQVTSWILGTPGLLKIDQLDLICVVAIDYCIKAVNMYLGAVLCVDNMAKLWGGTCHNHGFEHPD